MDAEASGGDEAHPEVVRARRNNDVGAAKQGIAAKGPVINLVLPAVPLSHDRNYVGVLLLK